MTTHFPSVVLFLRVFHGSYSDLDELFFPSYHHFWPRKEFWPNTLLLLLWDDGSEEDLRAAQELHRKWDPMFRSKHAARYTSGPPWLDIYEEKPPASVVCDVKKRGASDRPSNYGYIQQAHSYLEADLRVLQHRDALQRALGVASLDDLYLLLVDADMTFLSPVHPHLLFDLIDHRFVPRLHGVWGRRAEGDITLESNFRAAPPVADFMDQPPWILRVADFPRLRQRMSQVVFSNIHRFFIGNSWSNAVAAELGDDPPVAWLRWKSRGQRRGRHGLLRFYTNKPAKPSAAFFEPKQLQANMASFL